MVMRDNINNDGRLVTYVTCHEPLAIGNEKLFISDEMPSSPLTKDIINLLNGKKSKCFFPYDENGESYTLGELMEHRDVFNFLMNSEYRDPCEYQWWLYNRRNKAIGDTFKYRIGVCDAIKDSNSLKLFPLEAGVCCYGNGYYIKVYDERITIDIIKKILTSSRFMVYLKYYGDYVGSDSYSFTTRQLENYINLDLNANLEMLLS